ncbi:MAG TPA: ABC transporter [Spirochaetaceae bacterium]|nr:ABC transporter [Spirochaetaceae bacterium]
MTHPHKKRERLLFALSLSALTLFAFASTRFFFKLDLSEGKAHTLSEAARTLYKDLPDTLRISYYISQSLKDKHPGPAAIEDFLHELASVSRASIRVRIIDPSKDPSEAESFGVAAQQLQVVERSEQRVALVYTGIVVEYLDRYETIPALIDTSTLEYDLVKAVRKLVRNSSATAGFLVGDADKSLANDYPSLVATLQRAGYQAQELQRGQPIEAGLSVLFVLGNAALDRYDAYFVDQYLMSGGKVFFAIKGVDVNPDYGLAASALPEGGFLSAMQAYGLELRRELVLDQLNLTVPFQTASASGASTIRYVRYPHWLAIDERYANASHPISAGFSGLDLFWPSPLVLRSVPGVSAVELVKTSPKAWKQTKELAAGPDEAYLYENERAATEGQYLMAAALSGNFTSAFAGGDLPAREGEAPLPAPLPRSADTRIVAVSSADFLTELVRMSGSGFNLSFALAAADWLSSDEDLVAIRSRAERDLRLNKLSDENARSLLISLSYIVNLLIIPAMVIGYGISRSYKRTKRERTARAGGETKA